MSKKIKDYLDDFYFYTGKASDVNRQLALAGVAIVWIFKNPENSKTLLPNELIGPLNWLIYSLAVDLFQYVLGAIIWGLYFEFKECQFNKKKISDENIKAPNIFSWLITGFFFVKVTFMAIAYFQLLKFFNTKI